MTCPEHTDIVRELERNTTTTVHVLQAVRRIEGRIESLATSSAATSGSSRAYRHIAGWLIGAIGVIIAGVTLVSRLI